jgi:hypothetical protein
MNRAKQFPIVAVWGAAVPLTIISGLAAQLCSIGHGPILPVLFLAPYSAFFLLNASASIPVWIAALQFPGYATALTVAARRGFLAEVGVVILLVHCIGVVAATVRVL